MPTGPDLRVDTVIFGGGAAGLWTLDECMRRGHQAILIESTRLGDGQTIGAQGIIHGGLKYALDGLFRRSARSIAKMPELWRECLSGSRQPDLRGTKVRSHACHLWRTQSFRARAGMFGAKFGLRVRPEAIANEERPRILADCPGTVLRLAEPVIDPGSLLADFASRHPRRIIGGHDTMRVELGRDAAGDVLVRIEDLERSARAFRASIHAKQMILAAGAGNEPLARRMGLKKIRMQRRPLHMAMLRGELPELFGHCVDAATTRATITSARDSSGRTIWQIGGQVAEKGVRMERGQLIGFVVSELGEILPSLDMKNVEGAAYRVDRAEPATRRGARPDDVFVKRRGNVILAWPTKLALVPRMVERIAAELDDPGAPALDLTALADAPRPEVALPPWETEKSWSAVR
jgi:glycerol-3-phosphate dehydrogenase